MPKLLILAIILYEVYFIIRMKRAEKVHKEQQTEESRKALDRETMFLVGGAAAFIILEMIL